MVRVTAGGAAMAGIAALVMTFINPVSDLKDVYNPQAIVSKSPRENIGYGFGIALLVASAGTIVYDAYRRRQ